MTVCMCDKEEMKQVSEFPAVCTFCDLDTGDPEHWKWQKDVRYTAGGSWKCRTRVRARGAEYAARKRLDPVRGPRQKQYNKDYAKRNAHWQRLKAYRSIDSKLGRASITWSEAKPLMEQPCQYCGLLPSGGLDRIDNNQGHHMENVRPCCEVCNTVLGDLPVQVKDRLASGLRESREGGWLEGWVIPQKRHLQ